MTHEFEAKIRITPDPDGQHCGNCKWCDKVQDGWYNCILFDDETKCDGDKVSRISRCLIAESVFLADKCIAEAERWKAENG
ncbi:MAG: hypothetical protein WC551_08555 [Patescibacteria group bacterium]